MARVHKAWRETGDAADPSPATDDPAHKWKDAWTRSKATDVRGVRDARQAMDKPAELRAVPTLALEDVSNVKTYRMAATDVDLVQKVIMEMGSNVTGSHVVRILASKVWNVRKPHQVLVVDPVQPVTMATGSSVNTCVILTNLAGTGGVALHPAVPTTTVKDVPKDMNGMDMDVSIWMNVI